MPLVSHYDACLSLSSSVKETPSANVMLISLSYCARTEAMYAVVVPHPILYVGVLQTCTGLQHVSFMLLACGHKPCIFPSTCMVPQLEGISCGMHMYCSCCILAFQERFPSHEAVTNLDELASFSCHIKPRRSMGSHTTFAI